MLPRHDAVRAVDDSRGDTLSDRSELRIGVIGAGGRGSLAAYAHKPEDGVRLVAGCDTSPAALEQFKSKYGPDAFVTDDYTELLDCDDVDAVFVTTPDFCHEEHAVAALEAGKAVYLEKPMAITIEGCDRILRAAYERKVKLYLGHNMRHFAVIEKMKELIDQGAIGEVKTAWCRHFVSYGGDAYFKDWHAERARSTGLLLQKGAHDIDVLHWLCGGYARRVVAMGGLTLYDRIDNRHGLTERGDAAFVADNWPPLSQTGMNPVIDVEDVSMMLMHLDNGVYASYQQCHFTPDAWRNYTVIGTEGRIENFNDAGEGQVWVWNTRRDAYRPVPDQQHHIPPRQGSHGGGDPRIVAEFIRYLRQGGSVATSPVAARYSVAAGCKATESLRTGSTPMDVPKLDPVLDAYFRADTR
ncbi:MAG: Gfo/Idh/MocA family oxidoreductase [Phycisphaerae bacterium]|nr:Gfo/Idh/MocA family oxidoreductase [Phycisphaerae bacterium]